MKRIRSFFKRSGIPSTVPVILIVGVIAFSAINLGLWAYARSLSHSVTFRSPASFLGDRFHQKPSSTASGPVPVRMVSSHSTGISSPTPKPIPRGKQEFTVSRAAGTGPRLQKGYTDQYDPKIGENQTFSLTFGDADVSGVTLTLLTDTAKTPHTLTRVSPTVWEGTWVTDSLHQYRYGIIVEATSPKGTSSIQIALR